MLRLMFAVACSVLVSACTVKPLMETAEPYQIVDVEVEFAPGVSGGTPNFLEAMRVNIQNEAYRFSEEGREKRLHVTITQLRLFDPVITILATGNTYVVARDDLYNVETDELDVSFTAQGLVANQGGLLAAIIAPMLHDPYRSEQQLSQLYAIDAMRTLYGSAHHSSVAGREPTQQAVANYPVDYEIIRQEMECQMADNRMKTQSNRPESVQTEDLMPEFCEQFGYEVE